MENKFCDNCGNKIENGQEFCTNCGKKIKSVLEKEKNKKTIKIIISIIVIISVLIVGIIIKNNNSKAKIKEEMTQAIEKYKTDAYRFGYKTLFSFGDIESIGNDVKNYWHDHIYESKYSSIDDAVDKAFEKNSKLIDKIDDDKKTIEKDYKALLKIPDEGNYELNEIKQAVKDLYSDYYDFYDLVITPRGNYTTFTSEFSRLDSSGIKKYNYLNSLLGY